MGLKQVKPLQRIAKKRRALGPDSLFFCFIAAVNAKRFGRRKEGSKMITKTPIIVRYAETDQMGIAHHANYPIWFEAGRTDFIKSVGITYTDLENKGVLLPLVELNCRYLSPAKYEDALLIESYLMCMSRVKLVMGYRVVRQKDNRLLATGSTTHGIVGKDLRPLRFERLYPELYQAFVQAVETEE